MMEMFVFADIEPRKIKLGDDESSALVKSFYDSFVNFVKDNHIDRIVVKKRAKKGKMAGGSVSFKLEGLIQLNGICEVLFVSGQKIAASNKKFPFVIPDGMNRYQENAFMAASVYLRDN